MNVCHIMNYNATYEGNFIASLKALAGKIEIENTTFIFFEETKQQDWCRKLMSEGMRIFFISHSNMFHNAKILRKACKDCDILHAHFMSSYFLLLAKIVRPHIKIIVHFHNTYLKKTIGIKEKIIDSIVQCNVGVSKPVCDSLINSGRKKTVYIDNAVFFNRLDDMSFDNQMEKMRTEVENTYFILMFGSHFFRKGCDVAYKAVKQVCTEHGINIILLISCVNKILVETELQKIDENWRHYVKILPAINTIGSYYRISDIFISPSTEEGFCYAIPESVYCRTPVIRSDIESQNRNIPNDFIVPVGDVDALARKILEVLELPKEKLSQIVDEQRKVILKSCSINVWCHKVIELYKNVLGGKRL